jgi:hypothetical protein
MNGLLLEALYTKYRADKADAVARLDIYLNNSVGIGEHPQHTEEMDNIVAQFADAHDKLEALKMMISHVGNSKPDPEKQIIKG